MIFTTLRITETIFAFALVVLMVVILKKKKVVSSGDLKSYSKLMTIAVLPAVIFLQLSLNPVNGHQFVLVMIMFLAGVASMVITWIIGVLMRLKNETLGMLIITSTFGSSALIGYPLIQFAFPGNNAAMTDAILISELGVGVPIFTLCPIVASYYGSGSSGLGSMIKTLVNYLKSPIFIAVIAGIIFSRFQTIVNNPFLAPFWESLRMVQGTLTVMACLILGLQLEFKSPMKILPLFIVSSLIQIGVQPLFTSYGANLMHVQLVDKQVLILIAAMPSAVLGSLFATQYDCDAESASELVFLNIMVSLVGVPLVYYSMFH
ncbi:MAG: AEC family transporter [Bacteroidetes bacterium]|nr:AEC family transporter [Bacteroidota bacterium]